MKRSLPLLATIVAIYKITFDHLFYAVRIVSPWYVILFILSAIDLYVLDLYVHEKSLDYYVWIVFIIVHSLIKVVAFSVIAVLWHRHLLRGEEADSVRVRPDRRTWHYILRALALAAPALLLVPLIYVPLTQRFDSITVWWAGSIAIWMVLLFITLRLFLVLPATALDVSQIDFLGSWRAMQGNSIRLFIIMIAIYIPFLAANWFLWLLVDPINSLGILVGKAMILSVNLAFEFGTALIGVTVLSLAYAFLIEKQPPGVTRPTS